jgi:hypothetical protein
MLKRIIWHSLMNFCQFWIHRTGEEVTDYLKIFMKILTVCSGLDFINYTRRATIEAIHKINPELDILLFNSILNIRKNKNISNHINFHYYHFWVVERLRKLKVFSLLEYILRFIKWRSFFRRYDCIFLIDPNQYYLLPYINRNQKLIYLLRDPSILLDSNNFSKELAIIRRADLILGISYNLCNYYIEKYYGFIPGNVRLWSNSVDLDLWDYKKWETGIKKKTKPLIGLAGNIDFVIDIELLHFIAVQLPGYDFEIAGKLDLDEKEQIVWEGLLHLPNVCYLGFISYDEFPQVVINWDIGLVAAKTDHEYARYLNNNKQYQYLALGKPFVTYRNNADYSVFEDLVFIAANKFDYVEKIKSAINKSGEKDIISRGIRIASEQSAEKRAKQFLEIAINL